MSRQSQQPAFSSPKNIIAARLRQARRDSQPYVTQADLSARVAAYGVTINRAGISKIESGERTVTDFELRALAAALAVSVGWLVNEEAVHTAPPISRPSRRSAI